ncbi:Sec-independent protein translocase protein TatC [Candidatus Bealeia paramacronuclearis]|uniref:Sec-independent protein translocase protein TatC n=1 Tax=Candidatus Bealeia paramacronuclearis TaxID=1921001 RepID=A0ABZ2C3C6_9PROT|nr:Sec-independent protein translocase protein TatC [Candidatus Bealeia paramacronuclearis]
MNDVQKPLLEHLIELRRRLLIVVSVLVLGMGLAYFFSQDIFEFLVEPLTTLLQGQPGRRLIYTGLTEAFITYLKISFFGGLFLSFPVLAYQVWQFLSPGLYSQEKKLAIPLFLGAPLLFLLGSAMAYYVVCPVAWKFFLSFETPPSPGVLPIQLEARVEEYLSLVLKLIFSFGLCFQLPVVMYLLGRLGIVSSKMLQDKRKYAFLGIVIVAAIITPPDFFSPISLIIPLYALYEISIILVKRTEKVRIMQTQENVKAS